MKLKKKLNFDNIESYSKNLRATNDGWKMEAVSALLEMFDFDRKCNNDKSIELEKIVENLTQHYRKK